MGVERVERRLAAILAADVTGYSRLMAGDEAGTLARLKALRRELIDPQIVEHKGRVFKLTGDGLLVEFPSVVEAVDYAVKHQLLRVRVAMKFPDSAHNVEFPPVHAHGHGDAAA